MFHYVFIPKWSEELEKYVTERSEICHCAIGVNHWGVKDAGTEDRP